jgi:hypothetical protein
MTDQLATTERRVGRRAVVRTAAHAAWAIPAVQIATSVAANAVCASGVVTLKSIGIAGSAVKTTPAPLLPLNKHVKGSYVVTNKDSVAALVTLTIQLMDFAIFPTAPAIVGWNGPTTTGKGNSRNWKYTQTVSPCGATLLAVVEFDYVESPLNTERIQASVVGPAGYAGFTIPHQTL